MTLNNVKVTLVWFAIWKLFKQLQRTISIAVGHNVGTKMNVVDEVNLVFAGRKKQMNKFYFTLGRLEIH